MAFDKLIISSIVGIAKNSNKMDQALDSLKNKLIDSTANTIQKQIPIDLPFNIGDALQGGNVPTPTPELLLTLKPIPNNLKQSINSTLDTIEKALDKTIKTKNQLQISLKTLTTPLDTLDKLSQTLNTVITSLSAAITIIKTLPLPSAVPPAVGIPLSIINGFSLSLDTLKGVIDKSKGPLGIIPPSIKQIRQLIIPIINKLNLLDPVFNGMIKLIALIRALLLFGPNATQDQINSTLQDTANKIQESVKAEGLNSNADVNLASSQELLDRLDFNSNNPLFYKNFKLTIEYDPFNTFSFSSRRVKGFKSEDNITLYNLEDGGYSFAATPEVLVEEIKFRIDQYISGNQYAPIGFPGTINFQKLGYNGKIYQWIQNQDEWVESAIPEFDRIVIRSGTSKRTYINLRGLSMLVNNKNVLPDLIFPILTRFIDWDTREGLPYWDENINNEYDPINIANTNLFSKEIVTHSGRGFEGRNNALVIHLKQKVKLDSVQKLILYNRANESNGFALMRRIIDFQIEFYNGFESAPILVLPIRGNGTEYDFNFPGIYETYLNQFQEKV